MVFEFKQAAHIKTDAQVAGEMCLHLQQTVGLTAKNLLDANRDETAPLHKEFEWNDCVAAEGYRMSQASYIIRQLVIKTEEVSSPPTRAFISVTNEEREYQPLEVVLSNPTMREQMLGRAKSEMLAFITKYKNLQELVKVIDAMKETSRQIAI